MRDMDVPFTGRLNWQKGLCVQNINIKYILIYTKSGTNAVSTIIERNVDDIPFIVDMTSYYYTTDSEHEALYVCAYLNSDIANQLIKPFQTQGLFGARDICKKILEIPLPAFDPQNKAHCKISKIAKQAMDKVKGFLSEQNLDRQGNNMDARECGLFRNRVRACIGEELQKIDNMIRQILS